MNVENCGGGSATDDHTITLSEQPTCDHPITGVSLSGPSSGDTGETLTFNASPQPGNATTPIAYTWSSDGLVGGQGTNQATYRWTGAGAKTVQVTARNCGGEDFDDSKPVNITLACPKPIVGVSITGQDSGYTNVNYDFTASPDPADATTPITYTWSSDGLVSGQNMATATYMWTVTGVHTASVIATNCGGSANADHPITLSAQGTCTDAIASVTIGGPTTGDKDTDYVFTATVQPPNATPPINYAWSSANLVSGQGSANATYRWSKSGEYQIIVSAGNCGGAENDDHTIEIGIKYVYLPLVMRNH